MRSKIKIIVVTVSFGAAIGFLSKPAFTQTISDATSNAASVLGDQSKGVAKEIISSQTGQGALLDVGGLSLGDKNEEDSQSTIKYKYSPKKGPKGLQGATMPKRLFNVPHNGRP